MVFMDSQESGTSTKCFSMEELLLRDDAFEFSLVSFWDAFQRMQFRGLVFPLASHFEVLDVWVIADFVSDRWNLHMLYLRLGLWS